MGWVSSGNIVFARSALRGRAGSGIIVAGPDVDWDNDKQSAFLNCPLFVKYKKKRKEFRVHVFNGKVIDVQEKRRVSVERRSEDPDPYIRSHLRGWVFCRDNVVEPDSLRSTALNAVAAFDGLDFGGVDVIWNESEDKCYVLEINSAPGLEGTTLKNYAAQIKTYSKED